LRKQECEQIHAALVSARDEYVDKIQKWLGKTLPSDIDVVILNGGGSQFLEPSLERYFNASHDGKRDYTWKRSGVYLPADKNKPMPEIVWGGELLESVRAKFKIDKQKDAHNLAIRLLDCYGLFDYLLGIMEREHASK